MLATDSWMATENGVLPLARLFAGTLILELSVWTSRSYSASMVFDAICVEVCKLLRLTARVVDVYL